MGLEPAKIVNSYKTARTPLPTSIAEMLLLGRPKSDALGYLPIPRTAQARPRFLPVYRMTSSGPGNPQSAHARSAHNNNEIKLRYWYSLGFRILDSNFRLAQHAIQFHQYLL